MRAHDMPSMKEEIRCLFAELFGAFTLTFVSVGVAALALSGHEVDFTARAVAPGLAVMVLIYAIGKISGSHINPAVTLAFAVRKTFMWRRVPGYIAAQLIGATLAALLLQYLLSGNGSLGAPAPHISHVQAFIVEIILTFFLMSIVIGSSVGSKIVGPNAGIAVGAAVAMCEIVGTMLSGAAINPGVAFGSLFVAGHLDIYWIYLAGPIIGAVLSVFFNYLIQGRPTKHELESASGEAEQHGKSS
ncbi:MAG TPA: aquaporin [Candidatus Saccharimonadales bacterium]|nr:aquaporin [Candidatus Saccharimonadales bacterium]